MEPIRIELSDDDDECNSQSTQWTWFPSVVASSAPVEDRSTPKRRASQHLAAARARSAKLASAVRAARSEVKIARSEARSAHQKASLAVRSVNRKQSKRGRTTATSRTSPHTALLSSTMRIDKEINKQWQLADTSKFFRVGRGKRRVRLVPIETVQVVATGVSETLVAHALASAPRNTESAEARANDDQCRKWSPTTTHGFARSVGYALALLLQEALYHARTVVHGSRAADHATDGIFTVNEHAMKVGIERVLTAMPSLGLGHTLAG